LIKIIFVILKERTEDFLILFSLLNSGELIGLNLMFSKNIK
jgi:hypothetical protein